jgi:hypothetical protein
MAARGELIGEVDVVLKGGDGVAGELHGITAELLEVMVWLEKGRGELSTAARSGGGPVKAIKQRKEEGNSGRVRGKRSRGASWSVLQDQERARRAVAAAGGRPRAWQPRAMLGQRRGGVARAGEGQRRGARAAAGLGATRGSCQRQEVAPV